MVTHLIPGNLVGTCLHYNSSVSCSTCSYIGKTESPLEMLRSIHSQLFYQHSVLEWEEKGVPFRSHVYVPEVHPETGAVFQEREDEGHVFKVTRNSLSLKSRYLLVCSLCSALQPVSGQAVPRNCVLSGSWKQFVIQAHSYHTMLL